MTSRERHEEERLRQAFQTLHVPDGVNERTLARIEAVRRGEGQPGAGSTGGAAPVLRLSANRRRWARRVAALAACVCLVLLGVGGHAYATPTAYVQLDGSGQVRLSVNRFNYVVGAEGLDAEGDALVRRCEVTGCDYAEAARRLDEAGLAASADDAVSVDITCDDASQARHLRQQSQECLGAGEGRGSGHGANAADSSGQGTGSKGGSGHGSAAGAGSGLGAGPWRVCPRPAKQKQVDGLSHLPATLWWALQDLNL